MMPDKNTASALIQRENEVLFELVTPWDKGSSSADDEDGLKSCIMNNGRLVASQSVILA